MAALVESLDSLMLPYFGGEAKDILAGVDQNSPPANYVNGIANSSRYGCTDIGNEGLFVDGLSTVLGAVVDAIEAGSEDSCPNHGVQETVVKISGTIPLEKSLGS